jgi:hypothetical protein
MNRVAKIASVLAIVLFVCFSAGAQAPEPDGAGVRPGTLPKSWRTGGPSCDGMTEWEIHPYNPDLYIIRENGCVNYEKPFLYLFFGKERALMIGTGAGQTHVADRVSSVMQNWAQENHREAPPLIVEHSHSHDDHVAGDAQFMARANTTMVPLTVEGTRKFFGIARWPQDVGRIDLGDRIIDIVSISGHDVLSLAYYDRRLEFCLPVTAFIPAVCTSSIFHPSSPAPTDSSGLVTQRLSRTSWVATWRRPEHRISAMRLKRNTSLMSTSLNRVVVNCLSSMKL